MADKSNSNMSSSNNASDDAVLHRRFKHAVELEFTSDDDDDEGWSSGTSRRSVAASLRDFAESMVRREVAELKMMKAREAAREAARIEAENRRLERETELTEMMLKTQLQITSFICSRTSDRKRKRGEEDGDDLPVSVQREGAMLLSLLQFNLGM